MTIHLLMPWRRPAAGQIPPFPVKPTGGWGCSDRCSKKGAERTAADIKSAWAKVGRYDVTAEAVQAMAKSREGGNVIYTVKTNLMNGLPPRAG